MKSNFNLSFWRYNKAVVTILAVIFTLHCLTASAFCENKENRPDIHSAKAAVVTEISTGTVLYQHNAHERLPIASITKLMCMLIWAEEISAGNLSLDDIVTCSAAASGIGGSVIWLMPNEQMSVRDLIKSVVIASANDACMALCEHIAGSEIKFVERMNKRAYELGMSDTNYENCVGFDSDNHYSTAYDTALLSAAVSEYDIYDEFFSTRLDYVREGEKAAQLLNTNKLMRYYDGIIGGKTGTTDKAGSCLTVWARRGKLKLCAVTLGCNEGNDRFDVCEGLLDYGFSGFELYRPTADIGKLTPVPIENGLLKQTDIRIGRLITAVIPKGQSGNVRYSYTIDEKLTAPVSCGQKVGVVTATLGDDIIFSGDIVTVTEVEELDFWKSILIILIEIFRI